MTIKDLARNLNVSYSTVSKCLNNHPDVSEKTKERVLAEARRSGFVFNANARGLVLKKTNRIGVLFSNQFNTRDYRWFYSQIETYATRAIEENDYDFFIQPHSNIRGESNIQRMVNGKMVDGLLVFTRNITREEYDFLNNQKFPHVFCYYNPVFLDSVHPDLFWDDDEFGGYTATKHLIAHGHKNILTLRADDPSMKMYEARTNGYLRAMSEHGLTPAVLELPMTFVAARELVKIRLSYLKRFSALFVQQDQPALSIMQELKYNCGISVPGEISIVGYNNIDMIQDLALPLDTIEDPMELVIRSAVESLTSKIQKKEDTQTRQRKPALIIRGSVSSCRE